MVNNQNKIKKITKNFFRPSSEIKIPKKRPEPTKKKELKPSGVDKKNPGKLNIKTLTKANSIRNSSPKLKDKKINSTNSGRNSNKKISDQKKQHLDINNNDIDIKQNKKMNKIYLDDNNNQENLFNKSINQEPEESCLLFSDFSEHSYNTPIEINCTNNLNYLNSSQNSFNALEKLNGNKQEHEKMLIDIQPIEIEKSTLKFSFSTMKSSQMENELYSPLHPPFDSDILESDTSSKSDLFGNEYLNSSKNQVPIII